jgi:tetratricopeptide (TPR) repeat protein
LALLQLRPADLEPYAGVARTLADSVPVCDWPDRVAAVAGTLGRRDRILPGVGQALFELGRYGEARDFLLRRLGQDPEDQLALMVLARVEDGLGNFASARFLFERGLRFRDPLPPLGPFYLEHLVRTNQLDVARTVYRNLAGRVPELGISD